MTWRRLTRAVRLTVVGAAVATVVGVLASPATADPAPTTASEALQQYQHLSQKADKLNEKYLAAKVDLQKKRARWQRAKKAAVTARQHEQQAQAQQERFRGRVDELSRASYQGARFSELSALLSGTSPQNFLDRASALNVIATDSYDGLHRLAHATADAQRARQQATAAKQQAARAKRAAQKMVTDIQHHKQALQDQIDKVKAALDRLTAAERSALQDPGDMGVFIAPPGAAGVAMQAALSQRGKPYVWGADGPDAYDCSGLTMWAYAQAGISLPHSAAAQQDLGVPVSRSELQPGDLVFMGSPAYHVGIYVGSGEMVDAPTSGEVVKVQPLWGFTNARRLAG